jgi:hypothetical protein
LLVNIHPVKVNRVIHPALIEEMNRDEFALDHLHMNRRQIPITHEARIAVSIVEIPQSHVLAVDDRRPIHSGAN